MSRESEGSLAEGRSTKEEGCEELRGTSQNDFKLAFLCFQAALPRKPSEPQILLEG